MRGLSENLQCKNHYFFTKCLDLLDSSKKKILLDLVYMHPGGVHIATDLFFLKKCNYETPYCLYRVALTGENTILQNVEAWKELPIANRAMH